MEPSQNFPNRLQENERFLSDVFSSIQDGISILDTNFHIIRVNPAMEKWYSHAMPLIGKRCFEAYHCRDTMCEVCPTSHTLRTGKPSNEVVPKRGPGGKIVGWLDLYAFPLIDTSTGKMRGVIEYVRDITARKKAEDTLKESEERYRILFENAPDVVYAISADNETIQSLNPAFEKITGWRREEFIGKAFLSIVHPDDLPVAFRTFQQVLKGKSPPPYELRIRSKSGQYVAGEFTSAPLIKDGKIIGEFGIVRDITERKRIETELRETKERLEYILGVTKTNVDVIDADFNLRYVDPAWKMIYGEPAGRKCYEYFMGKNKVCSTCGIPRALKTKKAVVTEKVLPNENNRVIQVHTIPFRNPDGEWLVAEFNIDITDRKKTEEALRRSEEQYRLSYDHIPLHMGIIDQSGKFILWNKYSEIMLGYSAKEAVGKLTPSNLHESREEAENVVHTAAKKGIFDGELNFRRKNGETFPVHLVVIPYRNSKGEIVNFSVLQRILRSEKKWPK